MLTKTPLECVKSNSVTPEALMGKSWYLAVNEALYSAGHLSRDQGLSLIWAFSEVQGLGQTNVIRHYMLQ